MRALLAMPTVNRVFCRRLTATLNFTVATAIMGALAWQIVDQIDKGVFDPSQHFAYFTIQTSLLNVVVLWVSGWQAMRRRADTVGLTIARSYAVTYAVITALVFNLLIRAEPAAGAYVSPAIADEMLHSVAPAYLLLDWLIVRNRPRLRWVTALAATYFPIAWIAATMWRASLDSWVPYGFLDLTNGVGTVATYIAVLLTVVYLIALALTTRNRFAARRRGIPSAASADSRWRPEHERDQVDHRNRELLSA